jgi:ABC-2 type transport system ATP-binding protein
MSDSPVVTTENLNLVFEADVFQPRSWRDIFTRASKDPVGVLLTEKDRLHILKDLNLVVARGDRIGLVGINGAGKSSLCRCIAGQYTPTSGRITVRGKARAIFDATLGVQPELTGRENVELLARLLFPEAPDLERMIADSIEFSELGKFIDIPFRTYSNGMQTRLCLSLISARPCDLLILDEVFDGADAFFREKISRRVLRMIEESGAVIFVSHSAEQVRKVCNRMVILHGGGIAFDGDVSEGIRFYQGLGAPGAA